SAHSLLRLVVYVTATSEIHTLSLHDALPISNKRIIAATYERMGLPEEKVMINIQRYGNTTNGTLPLCLWEWEKKLKKGDNIILRSEEHTSELQSRENLVCRLLLEKQKTK